MMKKILSFPSGMGAMLCVIALAGCKPEVPPPWAPPVTDKLVTAPAAPPAVDVVALRKKVYSLEARLAGLESGDATVNSGETNFSIARTVFGPFTVAVVGMTPYLDGFNATLKVGNLTSANFNGAKVSASWGPPMSAGVDEYLSQRKTKEVDIITTLQAGAFTEITITLTPAKPEEVKEFDIGLKLNQLSLRSSK